MSGRADDRDDGMPRITAVEGMEVIRIKPTWESPVIGMIRAGQSVRAAAAEPLKGPGVASCAGGWYPVVPRGFVCVGQRSTLSADDPRARAAALALPDFADSAPLRFGVSIGAPRYLRIPTEQEQRLIEKGLDNHLARPPKPDDALGGAIDLRRASAGPPDALERHFNALKGPLVATKDAFAGMKVAWTREFDKNGRTWLVTPDMKLLPKDKVRVSDVPSLRGVDLAAEGAPELPIAYLWTSALKKLKKEGQALVATDETWPRQSFVPITDATTRHNGRLYVATRDGYYLERDKVTVLRRAEQRPAGVGPKDKWVSVRVTHGYLVAYEGDKPVFATAISPGAEGVNPRGRHTTRTGTFVVSNKYLSSDMAGRDRGKPWMVKEVPWVAFYKEDYGLHGAWWHDDFGRPRSHGCINLSPSDARFLFGWLDPALPEGWYAVAAYGPQVKGTVVQVRP